MRIRKIRVVLGLIIGFMLYVSFKILEPEIDAEHDVQLREEDTALKIIPAENDTESRHVVLGGHIKFDVDLEEPVDTNHSAEYIKEWFLQRYQVQWDKVIDVSPWKLAASWVTHRKLVPESAPEIGAILKEMATAPIVKADVGYKGTQLKMSVTLQGGQRAVFKPKWFSRDHVIQGIYHGQDRHNGEVASFHLSRIMGLGKTPLVVGRTVDMVTEIKPVATKTLLNTYFKRGKDTCFYGKCLYCRGEKDGVCAEGTKLEGVIVLWLPKEYSNFKFQRYPWQRTYKLGKLAAWETNENYCDGVKIKPPYDKGPRLLDITAASVFDYIIGNADRHHYETFQNFTKDSMMIMFDNGKTFGNPHHDEYSILAPVYQCCRFRRKTWDRLQLLKNGVLSEVLRDILAGDPITPVLHEPHYAAMDRRLAKALAAVQKCIDKYGENEVLLDDGYS